MLRLVAGKTTVRVRFDDAGTVAIVDLRTPFGLGLYRYGPRDDPDFSILRNLLQPGDVFIDCGANIGQYTLTAARLVGGCGRVIALEPAPGTCEALKRNIAANRFSHVTVHQAAAGVTSREMPFVVMPNGGGLSSFAPRDSDLGCPITVSCEPLDSLISSRDVERLRLIKLDIEGAEIHALEGARRLISARHPAILIEIEDDHLRRQGGSAAALHALLTSMGYVRAWSSEVSPNALYLHSSTSD